MNLLRHPACYASARPSRDVYMHACILVPALHRRSATCKRQSKHRPCGKRLLITAQAAADDNDSSTELEFQNPAAPFSAELLLAVSRLGHLERYREEIKMVYQPGGCVDLTRCGLLVSNAFDPQINHKQYYTVLEQMVDCAAIQIMEASHSTGGSSPTSSISTGNQQLSSTPRGPLTVPASDSCDEIMFAGLDVADPQHLLLGIAAINRVLFIDQGLSVNHEDMYDPLNGSLAHVLNTRKGSPYSLVIIYLHVAAALGLPCAVVGTPDHPLIRIGNAKAGSTTKQSGTSQTAAAFLVDVAEQGKVYWYGRAGLSMGSIRSSSDGSFGGGKSTCNDDSTSNDSMMSGTFGYEVSAAKASTSQQEVRDAPHDSSSDRSQWQHGRGTSGASDESLQDASSLSSAAANGSSSTVPWNDDVQSVFNEWLTDEGEDVTDAPPALQNWNDVRWYAATDAASSNTWKLLYGLTPQADHPVAPYDPRSIGKRPNLPHSTAQQVGVMESPFADLAWMPFQAGGASDASGFSGAVSDSVESICGSVDSTGSDVASRGSPARQAAVVVHHLTPDELVKYGGLQPVSGRILLQQLLRGIVLPLTLSSRLEEALLLLRCLNDLSEAAAAATSDSNGIDLMISAGAWLDLCITSRSCAAMCKNGYLRATDPFSLPDLRDEALTLMQLQRPEEAAPLLREYLSLAPGAPDADMAQEVLLQAQLIIEISRRRAGQ